VVFGGSGGYGIVVDGTSAFANLVTLENTQVSNDSVDIELLSNPQVNLINSKYTTTNYALNSANFVIKNLSSAGSGLQFLQTNNSRNGISVTLKNGAGTSASSSIAAQSTDISGTITITTGSAPSASDTVCLVNIQFPNSQTTSFTNGGVIQLQAANAAAASLSGTAQVFPADALVAKPGFYILTNSTALQPSTAYKWSYLFSGN
jgi:hypothetical protein